MTANTVLLVDDEPHVTAGLRRALRHEPFDILTADSAAAALGLLAQHPVDVVVSDERMPGMPGSVLLTEVRKRYPDTMRIILSGQAGLDDVLRAINDGEIYRFLLKPINATELGVTIRQAIQQQQLLKQSRKLLREYQKQCAINERQAAILEKGAAAGNSLLHVETDDDGAVLLTDEDECSADTLLKKIEQLMTNR